MTTAPGPALALSRRVLPFVLGTVMVGVAVAAGDRALLFPEGTALAFGCWTAGRPDWCGLGPRLVLAPLLCAAAGITAVTVLPARLPAELAALTAAMLITGMLRAPVAPAISAAVLPALAGVHSLIYALSVAVIAAVVWSGVLLRDRLRGTRPAAAPAHGLTQTRTATGRPATGRPAPARLALTWGITAGWLTVAAVLGLPLAASAPPLLASSYEWITGRITGGEPRRARDGLRLGGALTAAWTAGAVAAWQIGSSGAVFPARGAFAAGAAGLTGRTLLAGLAALTAAAAVLAIVRVPHAPVPAIALVPLVLGPPHAWTGVIAGACSVAVTVAVCYCSGSALMRAATSRSARPSRADGRTSPGATGLRHATASDPRSPS